MCESPYCFLSPGSKREILANLANFAYDPLNYDYFRQLNILDIFLGRLESMLTTE